MRYARTDAGPAGQWRIGNGIDDPLVIRTLASPLPHAGQLDALTTDASERRG